MALHIFGNPVACGEIGSLDVRLLVGKSLKKKNSGVEKQTSLTWR